MKSRYLLVFLLLCMACGVAAQPFCTITHYDETNGLSQRAVKQIAQDNTGMIWMATWNGLNRFDGCRFQAVKPHVGDGTGIYSDRIQNVQISSTGNLWCRIDYHFYIFDVKTHRFIDFMTPIEQKSRCKLQALRLRPAEDGTSVIECENNLFLTVSDAHPATSYAISTKLPEKKYKSIANKQYRQLGNLSEDDLIYSGTDRYGTIWAVTTDGSIYYTTSVRQSLTKLPQQLPAMEKLYFGIVDRQGNLWLRSPMGAFKLTFGRYPYTSLDSNTSAAGADKEGDKSGRAIMKDRKGRIWVSCKDATVRVYDSRMNLLGYLSAQGRLQPVRTPFASTVYCFFQDRQGQYWLGTKPDGLFRLREQADGTFTVQHFKEDPSVKDGLLGKNVYDIAQDAQGRLWIATMTGGLNIAGQPEAEHPVFIHVGNGLKGFPAECMSLRRILITHAGVALLASTDGLVVADSRKPVSQLSFRRHVGEADRVNSLSNVAVMDILEDKNHQVYVATESGGVNLIEGDDLLAPKLSFKHYDKGSGLDSDVALSLMEARGSLWVVSDYSLMKIPLDSGRNTAFSAIYDDIEIYDNNYWNRPVSFSEAHPVVLHDGSFLLGLQDGVIRAPLQPDAGSGFVPPLVFTGITIQNKEEMLAVSSIDTLTLQPDERNVIISFAALDYRHATNIHYAFRMMGQEGDSIWNYIGTNRSVTLLDLEPGTYRLQIRSTDSSGKWTKNTRTITIIVTPTFWETRLAKFLLLCLLLSLAYGILRLVRYIKAIKQKQKETLEAYLQLLGKEEASPRSLSKGSEDSFPQGQGKEGENTSSEGRSGSPLRLRPEDEEFMKRVMSFVETHLNDADVSIDDMAAATFTSKSGLNRKMKSLLGVTPAEFMRESRLQKAAQMLATTAMSIQEIALVCGFADQNYFSKCFKAQKGVTPSQYRAEHDNSL